MIDEFLQRRDPRDEVIAVRFETPNAIAGAAPLDEGEDGDHESQQAEEHCEYRRKRRPGAYTFGGP